MLVVEYVSVQQMLLIRDCYWSCICNSNKNRSVQHNFVIDCCDWHKLIDIDR